MHELWSHGSVASLGGRALGCPGGEAREGSKYTKNRRVSSCAWLLRGENAESLLLKDVVELQLS